MKLISPEEQKRTREKPESKRKPRFYPVRDRYIILDCGHYSTRETQEAYSAFRTSADLYMCEVCGIEVKGLAAPELPPQPDEPPF